MLHRILPCLQTITNSPHMHSARPVRLRWRWPKTTSGVGRRNRKSATKRTNPPP